MAIDRNPENGYEIQDSYCGVSGIMLRLKVVKQDIDYSDIGTDEKSTILVHGVKVLKELVEPWPGSRRLVCADSCFASVQAVEVMNKEGLTFIGVVKTTTKEYLMKKLKAIEMQREEIGLG